MPGIYFQTLLLVLGLPQFQSQGSATSYEHSVYYTSQHYTNWADAGKDCQRNFGTNGSVLNLETQEEFESFKEWVKGEYAIGASYWVGGIYNTDARRFQWSNGVEFGSWIPWGEGQPDTSLPVSRVKYWTRSATFATAYDTHDSRYLCEVQAGEENMETPEQQSYISNNIKAEAVVQSGEEINENNKQGMTYIGSLSGILHGGTEKRSYYYASRNYAPWSAATEDCKTLLGETGTLLCLETPEEFANFTHWLHTEDNVAPSYWVGGSYNVQAGSFHWRSGVEFGSWIPWDGAQPETKFSVSAVEFRTNRAVFSTKFQTSVSKFICEVQV